MDESAHCPYRVRIYMYMARCSVKRDWYATEISRSMRAARCLLVFFFIFIFFYCMVIFLVNRSRCDVITVFT